MKYKLLILFTLIFDLSYGQTTLIEELNKNIVEVTTISPDSNFEDLAVLLPVLNQKKIIGLGEATHGTKEFFDYKHRLIKYLVTRADFRTFIIEGDFSGAQRMNDYILTGQGNIYDALLGVGYGIWMTEEFAKLIEWIKEYNLTQDYCNKIKFYGCDIINGVLTATNLKDYLRQKNKPNAVVEEGLNWIIERKYQEKYSTREKEKVKQSISELDSIFDSISEIDSIYTIKKQEKRVLEQFIEMLFANSSEKVKLRDKFMAENIEWIFNHEHNKKAIFWAHNEHIANNNDKKEQKPTGYYLKKKYENNYYAFGFGFYHGKNTTYNVQEKKWVINDIPDASIKNSTDAIFSQCIYPNFILDFETVINNKVIFSFLKMDLYHRSIGAIYYPEKNKVRNYEKSKLEDSFDGIIFFRETEGSTMIKK